MRKVWIAVALAACNNEPAPQIQTTGGLAVEDFVKTPCEDTADPSCAGLTATPNGPGALVVADHLGLNCCTNVGVGVTQGGGTIEVTYAESGTECDCSCKHTLDYTLTGLTAGSFTLRTPGGEQQVEIE